MKALIELAIQRFGEDLGMYLLWEETCYPMDEAIATEQLQYLIAKADRGEKITLDGWRGWVAPK